MDPAPLKFCLTDLRFASLFLSALHGGGGYPLTAVCTFFVGKPFRVLPSFRM